MRHVATFAVGLLLLACSSFQAWADEPTCVVPVQGELSGATGKFYDAPGGLLLPAAGGLFRYDGASVTPVENDVAEDIQDSYDTPGGLLLAAANGLFRYDGARVVRVGDKLIGAVRGFHDTPGGLLVAAAGGLFRYQAGRVVRVPGDPPGEVYRFHDTPGGLLLAAGNGLFRYDGDRVKRLAGDPIGRVYDSADRGFHDTRGGPVLVTDHGLFRYDGDRVARVEGELTDMISHSHGIPGGLLLAAGNGLFHSDGLRVAPVRDAPTRYISGFLDTPGGLLVAAEDGLYQYDGTRTVHIQGEAIGDINDFYDASGELLLATMKGLFRYNSARILRVEGAPTGPAYGLHGVSGGMLLAAENGLFRLIFKPLSTSQAVLSNASELRGAAPSKLGVPTRWTVTHPCSAFLDKFALQVVVTNLSGEEYRRLAVGFDPGGGETVSFEATVPVPTDGKWTFRIVASAMGRETNVGGPSEAITFVAPRTPGLLGWLASWWQVIAASSVAFVAMLNLVVFARARYSVSAWRLATDESWGKTALLPQGLLLRHWQSAQLWLLDLYVQERRRALVGEPSPFLSLPLTGSDGMAADSDAVLAHFAAARHLWIQGGTGMGKTALFLHLRQTHFGGSESTASAIFRRNGYVLVPIEARRFAEAPSDEKSASAWVIACIKSVLSEGGLSFEDRGLLSAILSKGTLAVAIDGLSEVAREQAAVAFAAQFPKTPLFVTSQELGESPFKVWRLPRSIAEHVDGLLELYLGPQRGEALAERLRYTGLTQHLRSGYDVRLVIELARNNFEGVKLPPDRIGLYRAAVAAAWPEGDERLELLQAAAWKLMSERGPNEDKRRLKPDVDAPKDLLERLEAVRERSGRNIRLVRGAPPGYEFVHDQMNAYLAACWFADRPTVSVMCDLLEATKLWQDGLEAQRTLWGFVATMLDQSRLEALWVFAGNDDRRAVLGRALAERAEREGWSLTRPPLKAPAAAN